jgi:DNA-binding XRE family transcriptional regulator
MSKEKQYVSGDMTSEDIGAIIAEIRDWVGITQEGMAKEIGVKADTLIAVEEGRTAHGYSMLRKVCDKYDLLSELIIKQR